MKNKNTQPEETRNEELYVFRGKEFFGDPRTIAQLNYALALNRSNERYMLKKDYEKQHES